MNKKLALIPASLIIAGALALTGCGAGQSVDLNAVSYTHLRAHETPEHLACRLLLEKKNKHNITCISDMSLIPLYLDSTRYHVPAPY